MHGERVMSTVATNQRTQALGRLYRLLQKSSVPGVSFEEEADPVLYTRDTCTRVREGRFLIKRVSHHGVTLETAYMSVNRVPIAVSMIRAMSASQKFSSEGA